MKSKNGLSRHSASAKRLSDLSGSAIGRAEPPWKRLSVSAQRLTNLRGQRRLRLEGPLRLRQVVFRDVAERARHFSDVVGEARFRRAVLARAHIGGENLAGLLDGAADVAGERLEIRQRIAEAEGRFRRGFRGALPLTRGGRFGPGQRSGLRVGPGLGRCLRLFYGLDGTGRSRGRFAAGLRSRGGRDRHGLAARLRRLRLRSRRGGLRLRGGCLARCLARHLAGARGRGLRQLRQSFRGGLARGLDPRVVRIREAAVGALRPALRRGERPDPFGAGALDALAGGVLGRLGRALLRSPFAALFSLRCVLRGRAGILRDCGHD